MKFELNEDVIKAVTAQVKSIVDDTLTDILHPEFGAAYRDEKCPSDEYGNTWQSRARRLEEKVRALEKELHAVEVDLLATRGEREYYKSRVDALDTEIDILNAENERLRPAPELGPEITEAPSPFSAVRLIDNDGDLWSQMQTLNGVHWYCDTAGVMSPKTFAELKSEYGPLHVAPYKKK